MVTPLTRQDVGEAILLHVFRHQSGILSVPDADDGEALREKLGRLTLGMEGGTLGGQLSAPRIPG